MASGHQETTITITTVTAANRHAVALPDIGTEGALLLGYIIDPSAGTFDGSLMVVAGDPGAYVTPVPVSERRLETDRLSLTSADSSRQYVSGNPGVIQTGAGAWLVLEDDTGTGAVGLTAEIVIFFSVQ